MDYKRILQLHYTNGFSGREIAAGTGDSKTAVNEFLRRFRECNELHYPLPDGVTNEYIEVCCMESSHPLTDHYQVRSDQHQSG